MVAPDSEEDTGQPILIISSSDDLNLTEQPGHSEPEMGGNRSRLTNNFNGRSSERHNTNRELSEEIEDFDDQPQLFTPTSVKVNFNKLIQKGLVDKNVAQFERRAVRFVLPHMLFLPHQLAGLPSEDSE